jgi:signal transduction histidine kinase
MASSISHDLRHPMTAIMANAEFLSEQNLNSRQRQEFYQEVRTAINQMTDLVDSLLEFSRAREHTHLVFGSLEKTILRAIQTVRARPEFRKIGIGVVCEGHGDSWFDPKKLERVFHNLLLNACEVMSPESGRIEIDIREAKERIEIRVADNGPGIPEQVREKLFQPFVSYGKENGTGLGLTVVQKIVQDHGGEALLESTSSERTVFKILLPVHASADAGGEA